MVALATERKALNKIAAAAKVLGTTALERVHFFLPEELFAFLEERDADRSGQQEMTVRGYKVRVKLKPITTEQQQAKKQVIAQTILGAMRRLKDKGNR